MTITDSNEINIRVAKKCGHKTAKISAWSGNIALSNPGSELPLYTDNSDYCISEILNKEIRPYLSVIAKKHNGKVNIVSEFLDNNKVILRAEVINNNNIIFSASSIGDTLAEAICKTFIIMPEY